MIEPARQRAEPPGQERRPEWLPRAVYPFTPRTLELPSGTVSYIDEGEGPVLLFVHAGLWSFVFRDVIARLRDEFRCVSLDFPGHGLAPQTEHAASLPDLAKVLREFVETLGLRTLTLVLHDLGGPVGLGFAGARPELVEGLVLTQTFAWEPDQRKLRTMLRVVGSAPMTAIGTATNLVPAMTSTSFGVGRHLDPPGRRAFLGPFRQRDRRGRFHRLMRSALRSGEYLRGVELATRTVLNDRPVLSIFGERNDPFGFQERIAATFPRHHGVVVDGGNHFPMMDDPDLFATAVREWRLRESVREKRFAETDATLVAAGRPA